MMIRHWVNISAMKKTGKFETSYFKFSCSITKDFPEKNYTNTGTDKNIY